MNDAIKRPEGEYGDGDIKCENMSENDQRSLVFHLLYAADAFDYQVSLESIADNFNRGYGIVIPTSSEVFNETKHIIDQRNDLDQYIMPMLSNWRFDRLGACTRLIIRLGTWELLNKHKTTDAILIINESIELAKCFAEKDAYKFVNGILDEVAKKNGLHVPVLVPAEAK